MQQLRPAPSASMPEVPFFIVGSPRSGTTLLVQILNRHSRLFVPPETEFFYLLDRYGFAGRPFGAKQAERFLDLYLASRPVSMLGLGGLAELRARLLMGALSYRDVFTRLMGLLAEPTGKPRWGEKTPHHLHTADAILDDFPEAHMIALVRDGRAVTRSRLQKQNWEQNLFGAASLWRRDSLRLRRLMQRHPGRLVLLRYEDLVADPALAVRRVCEAIGEVFEPRMLDPVDAVEPRFGAYYSQSWMAKSTGAIDPSRTQTWRDAFSPKELSVIEHIQAPELIFWGYPVERSPVSGWRALLMREQLLHQAYRIKRRLSLMASTASGRFWRRCETAG
ncbi:sulfotransferase family protein [Thiorhodococcus minor]|uniref:Sulfotransferase n=1 Tax=Thiorhodococcus minor TaxID=57489 RepID=A0A6M0K880_9GAMM|nr:sulfotransferase [Thiorhodococcus minor]NEV64897.1 sulfotransferase [Thiorhodococcus minor]